jgi:hypothetical protein
VDPSDVDSLDSEITVVASDVEAEEPRRELDSTKYVWLESAFW